MKKGLFLFLTFCALMAPNSFAQEKEVMFNYGNMDSWLVREIEESFLIGGNTKILHEIGPYTVIRGDSPYVYNAKSPWATSNVMAKVGVTKCSVSVFPEVRGAGKCARLETKIESVKVVGLVDISVLASGSIYLGGVDEPIRGVKNPLSKLCNGCPFTGKPRALRFDYKAKYSDKTSRIYMPGIGKKKTVAGRDYPEVYLVLQKRWEDEEGNIYAKRVATLHRRLDEAKDWVNNFTLDLEYGDISSRENLTSIEKLTTENPYYDRNSRGEMKPIKEVGWADEGEAPTHIILRFSSSHGGAFLGSPGNVLWIDNVRLVYDE